MNNDAISREYLLQRTRFELAEEGSVCDLEYIPVSVVKDAPTLENVSADAFDVDECSAILEALNAYKLDCERRAREAVKTGQYGIELRFCKQAKAAESASVKVAFRQDAKRTPRIVFCGDCVKSATDECHFYVHTPDVIIGPQEDFYCADGKRREQGDDNGQFLPF